MTIGSTKEYKIYEKRVNIILKEIAQEQQLTLRQRRQLPEI